MSRGAALPLDVDEMQRWHREMGSASPEAKVEPQPRSANMPHGANLSNSCETKARQVQMHAQNCVHFLPHKRRVGGRL